MEIAMECQCIWNQNHSNTLNDMTHKMNVPMIVG